MTTPSGSEASSPAEPDVGGRTAIVFACQNCGAYVDPENAAQFQAELSAQPCPLCGQGKFAGPFRVTFPPEAE